MNAKSVIAAVMLIGMGIVFGVLLTSNFGSMDRSFALTNPDAVIGVSNRPVVEQQEYAVDPLMLSEAFINAAEKIVPTVVSITVTSTQESRRLPRWFEEFHRFFGPDFDSRQEPRQPIPRQGSGSGVIVAEDGYIITNHHVVAGADTDGIRVLLNDRREINAKLVGSDENTDLAVIKIDANNLPVAHFGDSDKLRVGEWVLAVGNPLQLTSTVTHGIVSALGRGQLGVIARDYGIENFIQTDAAINPGNSGGPLVNLRGEVIGINVAIATTRSRFEGYGFAIPINLARVVVEDIIHHGMVRRAYLGVRIESVDETSARAWGLSEVKGVLIQEVIKGGPAEKAGLKEGDIILSVEGKSVNQANELQMEIARRRPDEKVELTIYRDGRERKINITLGLLGDERQIAARTEPTREEAKPEKKEPDVLQLEELGITLSSIDKDLQKQREVDGGVLIQRVSPFSEAQQRNLFQGDIIIEVDRKPVKSLAEIQSIIGQKKPGDALLLRVKGPDGNYRFVAISIPKDQS